MPRRPPAVARVLERVTKTAREHGMFATGDAVLVCVSGGPDSVCLLYSLWYLRRLFKIRLEVFHFDHRLREGSERDAGYVRRIAERLGLPFHLRAAEDRPGKGVSVEAWATVARGNSSNEVRKEKGLRVVAEGHTLDDQAETLLLNLIRGTGLEGMTGIAPSRGDGVRHVQPLIDVERHDVEAFCRALHLRPRRDPMNADTRLLRNALRLKGIPSLERATGREIKRSLSRTADLLRAEREELDRQTVGAFERIVVGEWSLRDMTLDAAAICELSPALASRAIRMAVYQMLSSDWAAPWTRQAIEAVIDLAHGRRGRRRDLPQGLKAVRDKEYVRVSRPSPESDKIARRGTR